MEKGIGLRCTSLCSRRIWPSPTEKFLTRTMIPLPTAHQGIWLAVGLTLCPLNLQLCSNNERCCCAHPPTHRRYCKLGIQRAGEDDRTPVFVQTKHCSDTLAPVWNQSFIIDAGPIPPPPERAMATKAEELKKKCAHSRQFASKNTAALHACMMQMSC